MFPSSPIELFFFSSPKLFCFTRNFLFSFAYYFGVGKKKSRLCSRSSETENPAHVQLELLLSLFSFKQRATEAEERAQQCSGRGWCDEAPASPGGTGSLIMKLIVVSSQLSADGLQRPWEPG